MPDAFVDSSRVTKSHIPVINAPPIRIEVPAEQKNIPIPAESKARQKRGRPLGSKDKNPRKKRGLNDPEDHIEEKNDKDQEKIDDKEPELDESNTEISINYTTSCRSWNRIETIIDNMFAYNISLDVIQDSDDPEPISTDECRHRKDWLQWKDAIQSELNALTKHKVFGPAIRTPEGVKLVSYKWIFGRKRNENNEIIRYKARLVAQGDDKVPRLMS